MQQDSRKTAVLYWLLCLYLKVVPVSCDSCRYQVFIYAASECSTGLCGVLCINPLCGGWMSGLAVQLVVRCGDGTAVERADGGDGLPHNVCAVALQRMLQCSIKCDSTGILWHPTTSTRTLKQQLHRCLLTHTALPFHSKIHNINPNPREMPGRSRNRGHRTHG